MKKRNRLPNRSQTPKRGSSTSQLVEVLQDVLTTLGERRVSGAELGHRSAADSQINISVELERVGRIQVEIRPSYSTGDTDFRAVPASKADRVKNAKALLAAGAVYPRGCSEFVCAVLGIAYQQANDLMGTNPPSVGNGPKYELEPGDIAGWINTTGSGHVAVYIGDDSSNVFIDVREPGAKPRSKNGYYNHEMFKAPF